MSGPASGLGKGMLAGARAVFDDVNARGGIHGRKIELIVRDEARRNEKRHFKHNTPRLEADALLSLAITFRLYTTN